MKTADQLFRDHAEAKEYVAKIGKAQPHFGNQDTGGYLHTLQVSTQIGWQGSSGGTNYWKDQNFDTAFAAAVRERFRELRDDALDRMHKAATDALVAEEEALRARLERIEAIKAEQTA